MKKIKVQNGYYAVYNCSRCATERTIKYSVYNKTKDMHHFCSRKCSDLFRVEQNPPKKRNVTAKSKLSLEEQVLRDRCRHILWNAIARKRVKQEPCHICGKKGQAHHVDYTKPFDVEWLCIKHHRQEHVAISKQATLKRNK